MSQSGFGTIFRPVRTHRNGFRRWLTSCRVEELREVEHSELRCAIRRRLLVIVSDCRIGTVREEQPGDLQQRRSSSGSHMSGVCPPPVTFARSGSSGTAHEAARGSPCPPAPRCLGSRVREGRSSANAERTRPCRVACCPTRYSRGRWPRHDRAAASPRLTRWRTRQREVRAPLVGLDIRRYADVEQELHDVHRSSLAAVNIGRGAFRYSGCCAASLRTSGRRDETLLQRRRRVHPAVPRERRTMAKQQLRHLVFPPSNAPS